MSEIEPQLKEFNLLAQVNLLENDLRQAGHFREGTLRRVEDEEITHVVEGINTRFISVFKYRYEFSKDGYQKRVVAADGTPLLQMAANGLYTAEEEYQENASLEFHYRRAYHDFTEASLVENMMSGSLDTDGEEYPNVIISFSTFPEEAFEKYGGSFIEGKGYNPDRRLAFVRIYHRTPDDQLVGKTISFDNSDLDIFRGIAAKFGVHIPMTERSDNFLSHPIVTEIQNEEWIEFLPERIRQLYDKELSQKLGYETFYGRRKEGTHIEGMEFVKANQELINQHINILKDLAKRRLELPTAYLDEFMKKANMPENASDLDLKRESLYSMWAAMKHRLKLGVNDEHFGYGYDLMNEVVQAGMQAAANMERLVGCGGAIDLSKLDEKTAKSLLLGEDSEEKGWSYTMGVCANPPYDKEIGEGCPSMGKWTKIGPCSKMCIPCEKVY